MKLGSFLQMTKMEVCQKTIRNNAIYTESVDLISVSTEL